MTRPYFFQKAPAQRWPTVGPWPQDAWEVRLRSHPSDLHVVPPNEQHKSDASCNCCPVLIDGSHVTVTGRVVRLLAHRPLN